MRRRGSGNGGTSVPEEKESVEYRNSEHAAKLCESGSSEREPRAGLPQSPLYEILMHNTDSLVYLCYFHGQINVKGV